jgi:hypothetical protein
MISAPGDALWLYTVTNQSLFSLHSVVGKCTIREIRLPYTAGGGTIRNIESFAPQFVAAIRSEDEHTFRCPAFAADENTPERGGRVEIRATYRYLGFLPRLVDGCFELEATGDASRVWVRTACPEEMSFGSPGDIRVVQEGAPTEESSSRLKP